MILIVQKISKILDLKTKMNNLDMNIMKTMETVEIMKIIEIMKNNR